MYWKHTYMQLVNASIVPKIIILLETVRSRNILRLVIRIIFIHLIIQAKQEQVQIESIAMEEKRVEEQIDQLHLKLEALRVHRGDYIEKGKGIERKEKEERSKLKLCHDTLTQLKKDAEKVLL